MRDVCPYCLGKGCEKCHGTGWVGFPPLEEIHKLPREMEKARDSTSVISEIFQQSKEAIDRLEMHKKMIIRQFATHMKGWLTAEDNTIFGEFTIGVKYLHTGDNEFMPIDVKDFEGILDIISMYDYTYRLPVPKEMKAGYVLILEPK